MTNNWPLLCAATILTEPTELEERIIEFKFAWMRRHLQHPEDGYRRYWALMAAINLAGIRQLTHRPRKSDPKIRRAA